MASQAQEATQSSDSQIPMQELQDTVSRLSSHKGVQSVMILNKAGDILFQSGTTGVEEISSDTNNPSGPSQPVLHAKRTKQLMEAANAYVQCLSPRASDDGVSFLTLRTQDHQELMIAPHQGFVLAVLKSESS